LILRLRALVIGAIGLAAALPVPAQAPNPAAPTTASVRVIEVRPGDTFSGITARFSGDPSLWRQFYDPQRSRIANPNLIAAGSYLELIREPGRPPYLRLATDTPARRGDGTPVARAEAAKPRGPESASAPQVARSEPLKSPSEPIIVGVLPNIAAVTLLTQYDHMKRYLERVNQRKVQIATAANFRAFFTSLMQGEYDVAVSAPHFARIAQLDRGQVPLAIYEPPIGALFVSTSDSAVGSPAELRGKTLAFANPQSLVAMYGIRWLSQQKLQAHQDYRVTAVRSDLGVGRLLLSGEAAAAILSNGEFRQIPEDERKRLKVVEEFARIPNFIVLAHPRLGKETIERLGGQLRGFLADKDDGASFAKATGIGNITSATEAVLRELDPHVDETRRLMGTAK
jgi:phosphonate transport system substrate-binding protein